METDPRTELADLERLGAKARRASHDTPPMVGVAIIVTEIAFFGVFAWRHWSLPFWGIAGWWLVCGSFIYALRWRRRARPRRLVATHDGRVRMAKWLALCIAINAVWLPLWFWSRSVAVGVLAAALAIELVSNVQHLRHS